MVSSDKTVKSINTYSVVPLNLTLVSTPTKVLNNQRKTRRRKQLATIKISQLYTTASARFLSTDLHSVSQFIIRAHTDKIALYNNFDTLCCADSGASKAIFPDYSTFKTYHCLSNRNATLGNTTKFPIEGIGTTVYTLNGRTILTRNALHMTALRGPL